MSIKLWFFILLGFILALPLISFAGNPPDQANSSLVATTPGSNQVPANGSTQASLTLTLQDSFGTPLAGDTVALSASDPNIVFSPTSTTLDANGNATFSATSTTVGTDNVNVTDSTTSTDLFNLGQVIFDQVQSSSNNSSSNNTNCSNAYPTDAPDLYSVLSASSGSATLYFVQPSSTFDGFTISYGTDTNADTYNASFSQGISTGAITYTINDLNVGTKYYFKVRANNGCATGPWSQVLAVSASSSLPAAGPSNIIYFGFAGLLLFISGIFLRIKLNKSNLI